EVIMFSVAIIIEEVNSELLIRMSALEIILIFNASIGLYVLQFLNVYRRMLEKCLAEIEKYLDDFHELSQASKAQRLYMCLRRNFQVNEEYLQPGVIIVYTVDMCLLLIGYTYFAVLFVDGEVPILKFDAYVLIKSGATVLAFSYLCYEAQQPPHGGSDRSEFYAYDYQIFIKSVIVVLGQIFFCFESENLNNLV
ncbi:hypothetical protein BDFB_010968, partial [Asbolus verrucosus]